MRILIIGPSWIGDAVMSHSMYRLLIMQYCSKITIDVIVPKWCASVIHHMPEINQILPIPYKHGSLKLKECYYLGKYLKNKKYQQAIILPNSFKSALIPFFADISIRTGWRGEMRYGLLNDLRILNVSSFPLMIQRYAALAYKYNTVKHFIDLPHPFPWPHLNVKNQKIKKILYKFNLDKYSKLLIGLCPGVEFGRAKSWPHYHYITLTIELIYCGYHVVILGSSKDKLISKFIEQNNVLKNLRQHYHNLIGHTSLDEAIAIIAACKGIVSNDSGLMHIACALHRPIVALYGPSNPNFTPPLSYQSIVIRHIHGYYKIRTGDSAYGYHDSLIKIDPNQVLEALKTLLN